MSLQIAPGVRSVHRSRLAYRKEGPPLNESAVTFTGPIDNSRGMCNLCDFEDAQRRKVYDLRFTHRNASTVVRLCREHVKELKTALRGTVR